MNGVVIESMASLEEACAADAVVVGSGTQTREVIADPAIMGQLRRLDPSRQLLAGPVLGDARAGQARAARGRPRLHRPRSASPGSWRPASRCSTSPSSPAGTSRRRAAAWPRTTSPAWIIARLEGGDAAESALHYVAPVGEKEEYVARAMAQHHALPPPGPRGRVGPPAQPASAVPQAGTAAGRRGGSATAFPSKTNVGAARLRVSHANTPPSASSTANVSSTPPPIAFGP